MKPKGFLSLHFFCALVCILALVHRGRSFTFDFGFFKISKSPPPIKIYNGSRVKNDSIIMVYHNEMTVAVVELGPEKLLLKCNIIEIFSDEDIGVVLGPLKGKKTVVPITMEEMLHLMDQCTELDELELAKQKQKRVVPNEETQKNISQRIQDIKEIFYRRSEVLSGIAPGTKWCGTGDLAKDYHELGYDSKTDACCRNHDLCPVKIRSFSERYGLKNRALYTKSHCRCDDIFYDCLKSHASESGQIVGHIYFNLVKLQCLEDDKEGIRFRDSKGF